MTKALHSRKGFATVYIVIIFSSVMLLLLTAFVIANGYAASSVSEDLTFIAGRSVLSEFQPELYSRYGVFALRNYGDNLPVLFQYYTDSALKSHSIVQLKTESINIDAGEHGCLNCEELKKQLTRLGTLTSARDLISEADILSTAESAGKQSASSDSFGPGYVRELSDMASYSDAEYDEDGKCIKPESASVRETRRQASELLMRYNQAVNYNGGKEGATESIELDNSAKTELPSKILDLRSLSPMLSGGIISADGSSVLVNSYIVNACSNQVAPFDNTYLKNEAEYVLYGKNTDAANAKATRISLFGLRFSINLAEIFSSPSKLEPIVTMASTAFFMIPAPIAIFMLASAEAGTAAKAEVQTLLSGGSVPFTSAVNCVDSYKDYLAVIMLFLDDEVKLARLMDIMQLNVTKIDKAYFAFIDYCYGFDVSITYVNRGVFSGLTGIGDRRKTIEKSFLYK